MQNKTLYILLSVIFILFAAGTFLFISNYQKRVTIQDITAQFELEKEELEDDYSQLAMQYESYGIRINNDSLAELLDVERTKNLRLLEEIKTLKINNARRLSELRKELETARGVMRSYIIQIDSLNTVNARLREEKAAVTQQFQEVRQTARQLAKEKEVLTEKVLLASMLEARDITILTLTEKKRKASRISKTAIIEFDLILAKNISASVGEKKIYLRILQPDETPLIKSEDQLFSFEGSEINYSLCREIEYAGEDTPVTLYWVVEEYLHEGTYRADFFADGFLIGQKSFELTD